MKCSVANTFDYTLNGSNAQYHYVDNDGINGYEADGSDATWDLFPKNDNGEYVDMNGKVRPAAGGWTIGPYQQ